MHNPGCGGSDSNRESPAYEAGELPFLYPAMVAPVGFEPRLLVMSQVSCHCSTSAISKGGMFFRSEPPRPHMKGNENRLCGWCQWVGSNHRPMTYEAIALTD